MRRLFGSRWAPLACAWFGHIWPDKQADIPNGHHVTSAGRRPWWYCRRGCGHKLWGRLEQP